MAVHPNQTKLPTHRPSYRDEDQGVRRLRPGHRTPTLPLSPLEALLKWQPTITMDTMSPGRPGVLSGLSPLLHAPFWSPCHHGLARLESFEAPE